MQTKTLRLTSVGLTLLAVASLVLLLSPRHTTAGPGDRNRVIAQGGGTTILVGGTGPEDGFRLAQTTIGFRAERVGSVLSGQFECLVRVPETVSGAGSGDYTMNLMYVTGNITSAETQGKFAVMRGVSTCTGVGAGSGVDYELTVEKGGPGALVKLTVSTLPGVVFTEILTDGYFSVY
jgi:hypothetical protein